MRKLKISILSCLVLCLLLSGQWFYKGNIPGWSAAQNLTTSWADLGTEITVTGYRFIALYVTTDINNGANIRLRVISKHTAAHADEFIPMILTEGSSDIKIEYEYVEWNDDSIDHKSYLLYDLHGAHNVMQIQVQAGTAGAPTAAQIDGCQYALVRY